MSDGHRGRQITGCGGCFIAIAVIFVVTRGWDGISSYFEERSRQADAQEREETEKVNKEKLGRELDDFARTFAPELQKASRELEELSKLNQTRLDELEKTLSTLGRKPQDDPDWRRYRDFAKEIGQNLVELDERRKDAFLLWKKFEISQDPDERQRLDAALNAGRRAAETTTARMETLLEQARQSGQ